MIYQYVCKFYLNASHFITINNNKGDIHSHCFEIAIDIGSKNKDSFVSFTEIEKCIEDLLQPYQEQVINTVKPFDTINPELKKKNWVLLTLEFSETPTRSFLINVAEEVNNP